MAESEEELKSLLMKVKEESEKVGLKLYIKKIKIMASSPITSWQINGDSVETVLTLFFWAPKLLQMVIAAMKLQDAPWKKRYDQPSSVQFCHLVMSDSLRPHELQHARPPCTSPTPGVYPNPCPLSQFFTSGGQSTGVPALASFHPKKSQA